MAYLGPAGLRHISPVISSNAFGTERMRLAYVKAYAKHIIYMTPLWEFSLENIEGQCTIHQHPHTPWPREGQYTPPARIWCATLHLTGADHTGDFHFFLINQVVMCIFLRLRHLLICKPWLPSHIEAWLYMYYVLIAHAFYVLQTHALKLFVYVYWLLRLVWYS